MAYNWAREEEWRQWKKAEEEQLRELGVSEDFIKGLHDYDWEMFNADRRYYDHFQETGSYLETLLAVEDQKEIKTVDDLLNEIENPLLLNALVKEDRLTLQIVLMRINGFSFKDVSSILRISENAAELRWNRICKKIKKVLK